MTGDQEAKNAISGRVDHRRPNNRGIGRGVSTLREAATRLADFRSQGNRFKTRDLVALLLSHSARSWRASQPSARVRVKVFTPDGRAAIRIDMATPDAAAR